jgi:hypothetical protein
MNARILTIATLLFAATIAFGGVATDDILTQDAAASCTHIDPVTGCIEKEICELRERITGKPAPCVR